MYRGTSLIKNTKLSGAADQRVGVLPPDLQSGIKSSFPTALICTTSHQIQSIASTNEGDSIVSDAADQWLGVPPPGHRHGRASCTHSFGSCTHSFGHVHTLSVHVHTVSVCVNTREVHVHSCWKIRFGCIRCGGSTDRCSTARTSARPRSS